MNCPRCGVWAEIKESRPASDNTRNRRYECGNMHRFSTVELITPEFTSSSQWRPFRRLLLDTINQLK